MPIELLDVAGLVPGAHEGKGLGNKFLDDLRHADALIHVVDVSGTTDAEGKVTRGYDPSVDIAWLRSEIVAWIRGNLMTKWGSIKRRHIAVKATAVETLQNQFSGYGSTAQVVARTLDKLGLKEPLEDWSGTDFYPTSVAIYTNPPQRRDNRPRSKCLHRRKIPHRHRPQQNRPPRRRQEHRQDRQDARPQQHRPLFRRRRDLSPENGQTRLHPVHRRQ